MGLNSICSNDPALLLAVGFTDERAKVFFPEDPPICFWPSSESKPDTKKDRESDDDGICEINHSDRSSIFWFFQLSYHFYADTSYASPSLLRPFPAFDGDRGLRDLIP